MRLKLDAAVIKNKSGLGIRAGSFSPEAFFPFSDVPPEAGRVNPPGEKPKSDPHCLHRIFVKSARGGSRHGRFLTRL